MYIKQALRYIEDIPVFSNSDSYIENYDKISSDHLAKVSEGNNNPFMEEEIWQSIEESTRLLIRKYAKDNDKILDVGVGLGRLIGDFTNLERHGMDISSGYLKAASAKGIKCSLSLIEDMPYEDNYFDIITCTDVLEHVLNLNVAIGNILRVLKPGGILIIRVPYKEDLSWYVSDNCPYEFVHLRTFDENHLKLLMTKIFSTELLEWNTTGLWTSPTRLKYPIIPYNRWLKFITTFYYNYKKKDKKLYPTFFVETEINFIVKKKNN